MTVFTVRLTNSWRTSFDSSAVTAKVTYGEVGQEADRVVDEKLGGSFPGKVLPGRSMSKDFGYAIAPAERGDVTMHVELGDFEKGAAIFSGAVAATWAAK